MTNELSHKTRILALWTLLLGALALLSACGAAGDAQASGNPASSPSTVSSVALKEAPKQVPVASGGPAWNAVSTLLSTKALQYQTYPLVSLSADGTRAVAAWSDDGGSEQRVWAASAMLDGQQATWSTPVCLSMPWQRAYPADVAVSADGTRAVVLWCSEQGFGMQAACASLAGATALWSAPVDVSTNWWDGVVARVALSADGSHAIALWLRNDGSGSVETASATVHDTTMTWSQPQPLSLADLTPWYWQGEVGLSADGTRATAVWIQSDGTQMWIGAASAIVVGNTARWTSATPISAPGVLSWPQLALSANGSQAVSTWVRWDGAAAHAEAACALVNGNQASWGTPTELGSDTGSAYSPRLVLAADGTKATVLWKNQLATAAVHGSLATWSALTDPATVGPNPFLALLAVGAWPGLFGSPTVAIAADPTRAVAVWCQNTGSQFTLQGSAYGP